MGESSGQSKQNMEVLDPGNTPISANSWKMLNNKNAIKTQKCIEIGWWHNGTSVRAAKGGKSRKIDVDKHISAADLVTTAKSLFFPTGESAKGLKATSCTFEMRDFCQQPIPDNKTVEEVHADIKPSGILRFHLWSAGPDITSSSSQRKSVRQMQKASTSVAKEDIDNSLLAPSKISASHVRKVIRIGATSPDHVVLFSETSDDLSNTLLDAHNSKETTSTAPNVADDLNVVAEETIYTGNSLLEAMQVSGIDVEQCNLFDGQLIASTPSNVPIHHNHDNAGANVSQDREPRAPTPVTDRPQPQSQTPPAEEPRSPTPPVHEHEPMMFQDDRKIQIILHRVNILNDMVTTFKNSDIMNVKISVTFVDEIGADADGVSRDAYAAFWDTFFMVCSEGQFEKVPVVYTEYGVDEWNAVGRILAKGLQDVGFFPLQLSETFLVALLFGEEAVEPSMLLSSFLAFITPPEKSVVEKALANNVSEHDREELMDLFCRMGCHNIPTSSDQMLPAVLKTAHQNLIQESHYPLEHVTATARLTLLMYMPDKEAVREMYIAKQPTTANVLKLIKSTPANGPEEKVLGFLKLYIKSLDAPTLLKFLRFVTGADVMCTNHIEICFNRTPPGAGRVPVAHTCGPSLDLSTTYAAYRELKADFTYILQDKNCLIMKLV